MDRIKEIESYLEEMEKGIKDEVPYQELIITKRGIIMSFELDMASLIQKYLKEEHNRDITIDHILSRPRWERVWVWWKAKEKYEGFVIDMSKEECNKIYGSD